MTNKASTEQLHRLIEIASARGDVDVAAFAALKLSKLTQGDGAQEASRELLEHSLALAELAQESRPLSAGRAFFDLSNEFEAAGDPARAIQCLEHCRNCHRKIGNQRLIDAIGGWIAELEDMVEAPARPRVRARDHADPSGR